MAFQKTVKVQHNLVTRVTGPDTAVTVSSENNPAKRSGAGQLVSNLIGSLNSMAFKIIWELFGIIWGRTTCFSPRGFAQVQQLNCRFLWTACFCHGTNPLGFPFFARNISKPTFFCSIRVCFNYFLENKGVLTCRS